MPSSNQPYNPQKIVVGSSIHSSRTSAPPDLITFQYESSCVFVTPSQSYQEAIDLARKEFDGLSDVLPSRIALSLEDNSNGRRQIRISESAWTAVATKLPRGAIITVLIRPEVSVIAPPQYLEVPERHQLPRSRSDNDIKRVPSNSSTRSSGSNRSTKSTKSSHSTRNKGRFSFLGL